MIHIQQVYFCRSTNSYFVLQFKKHLILKRQELYKQTFYPVETMIHICPMIYKIQTKLSIFVSHRYKMVNW